MGGPQKSKEKLLQELEYLMEDAWRSSLHLDSQGKIHKEVEYLQSLIEKEQKQGKLTSKAR